MIQIYKYFFIFIKIVFLRIFLSLLKKTFYEHMFVLLIRKFIVLLANIGIPI